MTTCEYCGKQLRQGDIIHGVRFGTLTSTGFKPDQASAVVVICESCGNKVSNIVYSYLDQGKMAYPVIFNMYNELTILMKNGYKLIQAIAKLSATEQRAIQRMIETCKLAR